MRVINRAMDVKATAAEPQDASGVRTRDFSGCAVYLQRTSGTYDIEATPDGTNWYKAATGLVASGVTSIDYPAFAVRIVTTADGTATAILAGFLAPD